MANIYDPASLGIKAPSGGFQQGGWYEGRQYWNGTLSDPGVIHPSSNQQGAGQAVSAEVNAQSAQQQGVSAQNFQNYLQQQTQKQQQSGVQPTASITPGNAVWDGGGGGAGTGGAGFSAPASIDLQSIYDNLYKNSNISTYQSQYDTVSNELLKREEARNKAKEDINNNPWYSEGDRVGRAAKLDEKFNADSEALTKRQVALQNKIAMDKADIETKLNLEMKQFDINSQQAQLALSQFNTLLQAGAFDNASGEDIAAVTRSTGLSSNMIMSAVNAQKARNVQTSTMSFDDGTSQGFVVINSQTGEIISKQVIGASKPGAAKEASESEQRQYYVGLAKSSAQKGLTVSQMLSAFSGYLEPNEIYQLYQSNSKYGPDKASKRELERYGISF